MLQTRGLAIAGIATGAAVLGSILKNGRAAVSTKAHVLPRGSQLTSKAPEEISVVSYNTLCDKFCNHERLPHVMPQYLNYNYRWQLIQKEIIEFDSDIVCLQESSIDRWDELKQFMAHLGYDCVVQRKPHEVKLAIFWRCSKFSLRWMEERSRVLLTELALNNNIPNTTDQPTPDNTLFVVNVHLEGSPYRTADKVSQIRHALQRLEYHIESTGRDVSTAKLVVMGDFNSESNSAPCKFLREGHLEAGYTELDPPGQEPATGHDIEHSFVLQDVYETAHAVPPFTRKVGHRAGARLDFIWISPGLEIGAVMRPLPLEHRDLVERLGMPNHALPSDHLPVGAVLKLVTSSSESGEEAGSNQSTSTTAVEPAEILKT